MGTYRRSKYVLTLKKVKKSEPVNFLKQVVAAKFDNASRVIATGSMDHTARLFDAPTGQEVGTLKGHTQEVIAINFNNNGNQLITGSFDNTVSVWDTRINK